MAGLTWAELMRPEENEAVASDPLSVAAKGRVPAQTIEAMLCELPPCEPQTPPEEGGVALSLKRRGGPAPLPAHMKRQNAHTAWYERHDYVRFCVPMPRPLRDILVAKSIREKIPTHKMVASLLYEAVRGDRAKPVGHAQSAEELLGEGR